MGHHHFLSTCAVLAASLCLAASTWATGSHHDVAAGTQIHNTAVVDYMVGGQRGTQLAHNVFTVDQLLDVTTTWQNGSPVKAPAGSSQRSLLYKVTNQGNGDDDYALALKITADAGLGFTADNCHLYLDSDHDGIWSSQDTPYPVTTTPPTLATGASMDVLAVCDIPANAPDQSLSHVELDVTSRKLSGKPGTSKAVSGQTAPVMVVGMTGNQASAIGTYLANNVTYAFTSARLVTDKSGGHVATSGSRITYTFTVTPAGKATGRALVVNTPIPAHTTYVSGSLALDGTSLGDSNSDGDAGDFDAADKHVVVHLGDVVGTSAPRHIRFQVTIN